MDIAAKAGRMTNSHVEGDCDRDLRLKAAQRHKGTGESISEIDFG